jgi:very-short-patch-repair endonuclease
MSTALARALRHRGTDAERALWRSLRHRTAEGLRFRRQVPVGPFIADFACWEARLVVEVDGGQHSAERDAGRTAALEARGWRVLRFWNSDVLGNLDGVLQVTVAAAKQRVAERARQPNPVPLAFRERGPFTDRLPWEGPLSRKPRGTG